MSAIARRAYNQGKKTTILVPFNCVVTRSATHLTQVCGALNSMGLAGQWGVFSGAFPELANPFAPIQIVTLQTLSSQSELLHQWLKDSDVILIDEGHSATFFKEVEKIYESWSWQLILNFTATPFNRSQGVDERFGDLERNTAIVTLPSYRQLQSRGFLVPLTYHSLQKQIGNNEKIDLNSDTAISWMLDQWLSQTPDPRFAVGFCKAKTKGFSQIDRVKAIAASKGVRFEVVGDGVPQSEYEILMAEFESGQTNLLCIQALSTGWDMPIARHCLLFRPVPSRDRYVQIVGRVSRPHPTKIQGEVWDFAGNVQLGNKGLHPKIEDLSEEIDASVLHTKLASNGEAPMKSCVNCKKAIAAFLIVCPHCKAMQPQRSVYIVDPATGKLLSSMSELEAKKSRANAIAYFRQWRKIGFANDWNPFAAMKKCLEVGIKIELTDFDFWQGSIFEMPNDIELRFEYESTLNKFARSWGWDTAKVKREVDREFAPAKK